MATNNSSVVSLAIGVAAGTLAGFLLAKALTSSCTPKTVKHVFLARFKDGVTEEEKGKLIEGYAALPRTVKSMKGFEWGTDVSVEGLEKGFTHIFVTTFEDEEGRDYYLKHVDHVKFAQEILGHIADAIVVDYQPSLVK